MRPCIKKLLIIIILSFSINCFAAELCKGGNHAMIIIDMQPYFYKRNGHESSFDNIDKVNKLIEKQIEAINLAKKNNIPIIFIEYKKRNTGKIDSRLLEVVSNYKNVQYHYKTKDGMLDSKDKQVNKLVSYLESHDISNLIILGANGGACVEESILQAIRNDCNVMAYSAGTADFNFDRFKYPYKYSYNPINNCRHCTYRQANTIEDIAYELANKDMNKKETKPISINDTTRGSSEKDSQSFNTNESIKSKTSGR